MDVSDGSSSSRHLTDANGLKQLGAFCSAETHRPPTRRTVVERPELRLRTMKLPRKTENTRPRRDRAARRRAHPIAARNPDAETSGCPYAHWTIAEHHLALNPKPPVSVSSVAE